MRNINSTSVEGLGSVNRMKLLMNYDSKQTLNENKNNIFENINSDFVFSDLISPDNKYVIFFDQLIDLDKKKNLGSIWESIDNIRLFFEKTILNTPNIPKHIKEEYINEWRTIQLNESHNKYDLNLIKESCRFIFTESSETPSGEQSKGWSIGGAIKGFGDWAYKKGSELVKDTGKLIYNAATGAYQIGKAIVSGDVLKVIKLIGQGAVYFARWLRRFMYNPIGIVIDTVLLAIGVGKTVQWIPWAIIVALDIYELVSGDFEDKDSPLWARLLFMGFDVLGLVLGGLAAKTAKAAANPLRGLVGKSTQEISEILLNNPTLRKSILDMQKNVAKVPGFLQKAVDLIKPRFPKVAEWLAKMLSNANVFVQKLLDSLKKIFSANTAKVAAKKSLTTLPIFYGAEKGIEAAVNYYGGRSQETINQMDAAGQEQMASGELDQEQTDTLNRAFGD